MNDKKYDGYIVVGDTGMDEKDVVFPFVFPDEKTANDFVIKMKETYERGKDKFYDLCSYAKNYYVINLFNTPSIDKIHFWIKQSIDTQTSSVYGKTYDTDLKKSDLVVKIEDGDYKQSTWDSELIVTDEDELDLVKIGTIRFDGHGVTYVRMSFNIPLTECKEGYIDDNLLDSLKLYCLEMTKGINEDFDKFYKDLTLTVSAEELNRISKKACEIVKDKYNDETFIKLFREEDE